MRYLVPHAVLLLALVAWFGHGVSPHTCLALFAIGHLAVPIWAAAIAPRGQNALAILLGPGLIIGLHALGILFAWLHVIGGFPGDHWITKAAIVIWMLALAGYTLYCIVAYAIVASLAKRSR